MGQFPGFSERIHVRRRVSRPLSDEGSRPWQQLPIASSHWEDFQEGAALLGQGRPCPRSNILQQDAAESSEDREGVAEGARSPATRQRSGKERVPVIEEARQSGIA